MNTITHNKWSFDYVPNKFTYKFEPNGNHFKYDDSLFYKTDELSDFRKASVIHRIVREQTKNILHDSVSYSDIAEFVELNVKKYTGSNGGMAFPVGISVNEIAAHDTALINDSRMLKKDDVVKIDIGIHINGKIIDSAFTHIVDAYDQKLHRLYPLLESTHDAVYSAIRSSGVDMCLYDLSSIIREIIESYEVDDKPISAINGLGGHNILPYKVHGGKLILSKPHDMQKHMRMVDGEFYAIETFASTGDGNVVKISDFNKWSHFGLDNRITDIGTAKYNDIKNTVVLWSLEKNNNLPFTQRWCYRDNVNDYIKYLKEGISHQNIVAYPPLTDKKKTYTSQFEHTIHVKENGVEILSLGQDY